MIAPATAPAADTARARHPAVAIRPLTTKASSRFADTVPAAWCQAVAVTRLAIHRTAPAVAGTDTLSSRRTGIVSTKLAITAAAAGPTTRNAHAGVGCTAAAVHDARAIPAALPPRANATIPATLLSAFHGSRPLRVRDPTMVANPSPNAMMPHAAATMSGRLGKTRMSSNTETGYSAMPSGNPRTVSTGR